MTRPPVSKPAAAPADDIATAEADLRAALLAGQPTTAHRARIAELHAAVARAATERAEADARAEAAEGAAIAAMARSIVAQAGARLAARAAEPFDQNTTRENHVDHPLLAGPAANVATATRRATTAETALIAAAESEMKIVARIDDLRGRHVAIVGRRARGETSADDGADLALLGADVESLIPLLADAQQATAAARRQMETARGQLDLARQALHSVEGAIELDALAARAGVLDAALSGALGRLAELRAGLGRNGPQMPYVPSVELSMQIRKLLAQAGRL